MYSDAAGTVAIANGATVPSGQQIWMRATSGSSSAVLEAKATATVPSGNVYLYAGNTAGYNDAQRLILAENATLTTTVQATANFFPVGSLEVKKTIAGPAAGSQGPVVIHVACTDGKNRSDISIPAGAPAGDTTNHLSRHPGRNDVHRHRDIQRQQHDNDGGGDRGRSAGDHPLRRNRDGPRHEYL